MWGRMSLDLNKLFFREVNEVKKHCLSITAAFMMLTLLCACGAKNSYPGDSYMVAETMAATSAAKQEAYMAPMAEMAVEDAAAFGGTSMVSGSSAGGAAPVTEEDLSGTVGEEVPASRKLIRNVNLSLQTIQYDAVVENLRARVAEFGGYIEQSDLYDAGYYGRSARSMNMTARIPADRLDAFLETATENAKVTNRSENTQDITLKYTDMEARVETLEVERDRLMELLAEADNIDSIIALESRLSEIRYELESIKSSLRVYDNQVTYSTVWINLNEVEVLKETKEATFSERLSSSFKQNLLDLMDTVTDLLIWFLSNLPAIILVFIVVWIVIGILRAIFSKERREARKEKKRLKKEQKLAKKEHRDENGAENKPENGSGS